MHVFLARLLWAGPVLALTVVAVRAALRALPLDGTWRFLFAACLSADVAVVAAVAWAGLLAMPIRRS